MYRSRRPKSRSNLQHPAPIDSPLYQRMRRKELIVTLVALLIAILLFTFFEQHHRGVRHSSPASQASQTASFNKSLHSLADPTSLWVVVNKRRPLSPLDYAPADLVKPDIPLRLSGNDSEMQLRLPAATAL